jgi:hypothetical protein
MFECLLCKVRDVMTILLEGPEEYKKNMSSRSAVDRYSRANSIDRSEGGLWLLERVGRKQTACCNATRVLLCEAETSAVGYCHESRGKF